ncbi:MAG: hypothetical protein PUP93_13725 [Rhizonema sp. NSF051]|nr:hypothetical protein [Rhizonema sp. NSF051]
MTATKKTPEEFQFGSIVNTFVSQTEKKTEDNSLLPLASIVLLTSCTWKYVCTLITQY